ncbi:DMT family transporter [Variovorax sp. V59]|uniref:Drug/metabolite transporter (DMT)-like permease n=2 Tax=Variovorax TaxID=34072 RepID=A0AAE3XUX3_VARPD|nr:MULTISPECIES: DMT family transporter [Variovorax]MDP9963956.1 drug/metabolite transporter (DMT)-like permease [Variovorax paradoxus]MDR6425304.1 drug/metabolite transporter (DMT)-like permease [Variovorax paradoxus]TWD87584.1 EamA-like transporter family protein [Variovorax beijingensis]
MPALALIFNAFVWGVSWFPFRHIESHGLHPVWTTCIIYVAISAVMGFFRRHAWRGFAAYPMLVLLGLAAGFTNLGFNWAVTQGDVVRVVLLFYLMPLWSVLLGWAVLGERPTGGALARVALALTGVAVVLKTPGVEWPVPSSLPDWLGLAAGFSFAVTNIVLRHLRDAPGESRALAMFCGCATVAAIAAAAGTLLGAFGSPLAAEPGWIGWAALLGTGFVVANVCLQYGAARLAASATAVIMLSEVLFASVSSVALGAAQMDPRILAGGALIVLAAVWSAFARTPARGDDRLSSPT